MEKINKNETTFNWWNIIEGTTLKPFSGNHYSDIKQGILFETHEDGDDGTFPRVSDWSRFVNSLDNDGTGSWLRRIAGKKRGLKIKYDGALLRRDGKFSDRVVIEFDKPVNVVFGTVGNELVTKEVKSIAGEFMHEYYWTKRGRQDKIANGVEIWFEIREYIE